MGQQEPATITTKDGQVLAIYLGGVGEVIDHTERTVEIHQTLSPDFWK